MELACPSIVVPFSPSDFSNLVYLVVEGAQRGLDVEGGVDLFTHSGQEDDIKGGGLPSFQHLHTHQVGMLKIRLWQTSRGLLGINHSIQHIL